MKNVTSRGYAGKRDFQTIIDLIYKVRPPDHLNDYPGKVDLEEAFSSLAVRRNTRLWFDGEELVAWACVDGYDNLLWEMDSQYAGQLDAEIMRWGEKCVRRNLSGEGKGDLYAHCREDYTGKIYFLRQHGFHQLEDSTITLVRLLSDELPSPQLPAGFTIRPILGRQEAEAVAAMHRAAFGTEYMTTENRLIIMSTSGYDPSLDLVVVAPDGSIAANCICSVNEQEKIGYTDPVSAHPRFQGMGLVRALLLTGSRLLKERGMTRARLGTSGDNIRMQRSAESVGYKVEYKTIWFSKEVN